MVNVPLGYRFHPAGEELMYYLFCFVSGKPLPCKGVIGVKNLYGDEEPWEIWRNCKEAEYFFTPLKKASHRRTRFARTVGKGKGTWSGRSKTEDIMNRRKQVIGHCRTLRYLNKESDEDGVWLMTEYSLAHTLKRYAKDEYKDFVLCRIKRKGPEKNSELSDEQKNLVLQIEDAEACYNNDCIDLTEQMTTQVEANAVDGNSQATNHVPDFIQRTDVDSAATSCGNIKQSGENLNHYNPASPVSLEEVNTLNQWSHGTDLPMHLSILSENCYENVFQNQFHGSTSENLLMTQGYETMFGNQLDGSTSENPLITNVSENTFGNQFDGGASTSGYPGTGAAFRQGTGICGATSSRTTTLDYGDWIFNNESLWLSVDDYDYDFNYTANHIQPGIASM